MGPNMGLRLVLPAVLAAAAAAASAGGFHSVPLSRQHTLGLTSTHRSLLQLRQDAVSEGVAESFSTVIVLSPGLRRDALHKSERGEGIGIQCNRPRRPPLT